MDRDDAAETAPREPASPPAEAPVPTSSDLPAAAVLPGASGGTAGALAALDSVASNISRLVYDSALIDAWDRRARGEHGAFTMRLYTPAGQQTVAEVRGRYDADPEFRDTVDRYVREFERLLAGAGRDDEDGTRVRGIIAAATGKVYVLLAHAAGRLD